VDDEKNREVLLQRELPFARALVWRALTDPEHVNRWWGPDGFTNQDVQPMDLRVGGQWRFVMVGPDGTRFPNHIVYTEVVPLTRLVFDHGDGERVWFIGSVTLQDTASGGTLVTLRHLFPSQAERDHVVQHYGAIEGGRQHLAKLEAYLRQHLAR
jgi:uncharacterized protein YndB with AHSA1/START domain